VTDEFSLAWEAFFRASRRARGRAAGPMEGSRLTLSQYQLVEALRSAGALPVSELAASAGVAPPTATRMLDALVREGVVRRTPCEDDRRVVRVALTAAGRVAVEGAGKQVAARRTRVRDRLTEDEQARAAAQLRRLAAVLDEEL
jgi:DNA-binding MarR family transcriptional regulator